MEIDELKQLLKDNGFEIFAASEQTVRIAERVRVHLMDSGVTVVAGDPMTISFVVRSEAHTARELDYSGHLSRIRAAVSEEYAANGFTEVEASERGIEHPGDATQTLDVWYEVRFGSQASKERLVEQLRYCLSRPKCVT